MNNTNTNTNNNTNNQLVVSLDKYIQTFKNRRRSDNIN